MASRVASRVSERCRAHHDHVQRLAHGLGHAQGAGQTLVVQHRLGELVGLQIPTEGLTSTSMVRPGSAPHLDGSVCFGVGWGRYGI